MIPLLVRDKPSSLNFQGLVNFNRQEKLRLAPDFQEYLDYEKVKLTPPMMGKTLCALSKLCRVNNFSTLCQCIILTGLSIITVHQVPLDEAPRRSGKQESKKLQGWCSKPLHPFVGDKPHQDQRKLQGEEAICEAIFFGKNSYHELYVFSYITDIRASARMAGGIPKLLLNIQGRHQELHGLRTEEGHGPQDLALHTR